MSEILTHPTANKPRAAVALATVLIRVPYSTDAAVVELYEEAKRRGTTTARGIEEYYGEVLLQHAIVARVAGEIEVGEAA